MAKTSTLKILLSALLFMQGLMTSAYTDHRHTKVDSAEQVLKSGKPLTERERMDCYHTLIRGYLGKDSEKHNRYCHEMLALTYRMNALNMRESALYHLGLQHYGKEQYEEAERHFFRALAVTDSMRGDKRYTERDIDDNLSQIYGALGNLYNLQDKALLAIEYYQKALPIFEKYDWKESQTILHHNVAELWLTMGNNEKAEQEYLRAIETGTASGDSLMMALPRKGLSKIYLDKGDYNQLRGILLPAYDYYHAHRDEEPNDYAEILASMAKMYLMDGHKDLPKARAFAQEALNHVNEELMGEIRFDIYAANTMVAMADRHWQQALHYGLQSVHADSAATISDKDCYMLLAQIYMELGRKDKAREYMQKTYDLMNRYATEHYQSGLSQMEVIHETEKKEAKIAAMTQERRLHLWLLAAAIGLIMLLAVMFVYRHLAHRRQKALLAARVALETETKERRILARDLHDSLGGMLSLLRLKIEAGEDDVLPLLDATHTELRRVSHHLLPEELLRKGLAPALHDFTLSVPGARFMAVGNILLDKDRELVLYRCAYELVNNALKHARADHIGIQLMQDAHEVTLTVNDDGKGIGNDKTDGMGMQNIRERIEPYHGTIRMVANENDGTEINISLPL